jgi:uncharacterized protein
MKFETAMRAIDFVASNAVTLGVPSFELAYHGGGEPTVAWEVLTGSVAYARNLAGRNGLQLRTALATNAVVRDDQIDWIVSHLDGASISFDGLPQVHDRCRLTGSGQGSSERVMHTLRRFDEAGFGYTLRLTVTEDAIRNLPDSVEFIFGSFRPQAVQVEPVYLLGRWQSGTPAETEAFIASFRAAQQRALRHGREITFSAARLGCATSAFCGALQGNFCVSANGNITACYEVFSEDSRWADLFFYGRPAPGGAGYVFDSEVLRNLRNQSVQNREFCRSCFAKWTCGGDCYHKSLSSNRDGQFAGAGRCHITRELTKDLLLSKIAASGGLFWCEPRARPDPTAVEAADPLPDGGMHETESAHRSNCGC